MKVTIKVCVSTPERTDTIEMTAEDENEFANCSWLKQALPAAYAVIADQRAEEEKEEEEEEEPDA